LSAPPVRQAAIAGRSRARGHQKLIMLQSLRPASVAFLL
jgi:hypothetical protein